MAESCFGFWDRKTGHFSSHLSARKRKQTKRNHTVGDGALGFKRVPPGGDSFKTAFFPKCSKHPRPPPGNEIKTKIEILSQTHVFFQNCFSYLRQAADSCFFRTGHACSKLTSGCVVRYTPLSCEEVRMILRFSITQSCLGMVVG